MSATITAEQIAAVVDAQGWGTPTAARRGRTTARPYVPVVRYHDGTKPGPQTEQILGLAYGSRNEAITAAEQVIDRRRAELAAGLADPLKRALREHHGLPRDIGSTSFTVDEWLAR